MAATNYTPIDNLLPQTTSISATPPKPKTLNLHVKKTTPAPIPSTPPPVTKESEPYAKSNEIIQFEEPLEKQLPEDLKPYVDVRKEKMEISEELKKIGLKEADPSLFKDIGDIKLPISDDKVMMGTHAPITSAFRWLATFALYLLRRSHLTLKTIHGRVVRVIKK